MKLKRSIEQVIEKIGKYYYDDPSTRTNGEFDIVTLDENGFISRNGFNCKPKDNLILIDLADLYKNA